MGKALRPSLILLALSLSAAAQTAAVRTPSGVSRLPVEAIVAAAAAGEMGAAAPPEALKAMAVAARTYIRVNSGRHRNEGFDFCSTTHCQRLDLSQKQPQIEQAVAETEAIILWWKGSPALVFHSADCGGRTASAGEIWPGLARPYLPSKEDPWCGRSPAPSWTARIEWPVLDRILGLSGLRFLAAGRRGASGRVLSLRSNRGPVDAESLHLAVGRSLGWNVLRSRLYDVESTQQAAEFRGRGAGHGVGLCQKGAIEMAKNGADFREILAFYFPGAIPGITPRGLSWRRHRSESLDLLTAGDAPPVSLPAAGAAWLEARRRSSLDAACRPTLREYPSVDLFRDSTGASGAFAAITRGCSIHLNQPARLQAQGRLPQILLHEMMHVLIEANRRAPLPAWFEEGLAEHLAGGTTRAAERARVEHLIRRYGRASVLRFLQTGLPQ